MKIPFLILLFLLIPSFALTTEIEEPVDLAKMDSKKLKQVSADSLCAAYYAYPKNSQERKRFKKELKRRQIFSREEWDLISKHKIRIGMNRSVLLCSWGYPRLVGGRINSTITKFGKSSQWIYPREQIYIYLENGKITAWQDYSK